MSRGPIYKKLRRRRGVARQAPAWGCLTLIAVAACSAPPPERAWTEAEARQIIHASVQALTDVMVHDIFSPPQASRSYAYPLVAYYEAARHADSTFASYAGQLNGLEAVPGPEPGARIHPLLAGTHAFFRVADEMVFSQSRLHAPRDTILAAFDRLHLPPGVAARSVAYGDAVADHVLAWAAADGYAETRALPRYATSGTPGAWEPTPPAYLEPIEPHWSKLRPFVLDRADQFVTEGPPPFSLEPGSAFHDDILEVYEAVNMLTDEQRAIAAFWDCNPFVVHAQGHLAYGAKKISPGGHWMGITGIAIEEEGDAPVAALATYSHTALALADAFIASWDEKYRSNLVRPETVIRAHVDPTWEPVLQTPPFPEYTSGHSVISTAAATVLTSIYGDDFAFVDDVEVKYGLPERAFDSFIDASQEAAISRLYGGIHYLPAIENGVEQGRQVGALAVDRIDLRPAEALARR